MLTNNFNILKINLLPIYISLYIALILNFLNNFIFKKNNFVVILTLLILNFLIIYSFLMNLKKENIIIGQFSKLKESIDVIGFSLFIISELIVFISLFWSYIHNAYTPNQYIGNFWPPKGIEPSNPTSIIIFGTSILLSSSLIIMYCHNNLINKNNRVKTNVYLLITILIGLLFMDIQIIEISNFILKLQFNFNDSIFRSSFLFTTSLHARHVLFGIIGLIISLVILNGTINNSKIIINMEIRIWYWHFVDYIWIGVFSIFYYLNV